jgi:GTP-binding protein
MSKFIDEVTLSVKAGDGGPGSRSFRREKFVPMGGPDGGKGGNGGNIVLQACHKVQSLIDLKSNKIYKAKNGNPGMGRKKFGANGDDLVIMVPIGTQIFNEKKELLGDLTKQDEIIVIAKGGKGGLGNASFSSSVNRSPQHAQQGMPGEELKVLLELKLIAEIGLIGLPNAGKSSLLKALTYANTEIGDYPFTTIHPNLGTLKTEDKEIIMADIPGLIQGASEGKGLGFEFLRHIDRTKLLIHLVAADYSAESVFENYAITVNELEKSPYDLISKPTLTLLSKSDLVNSDIEVNIINLFKKNDVTIFPVSSFTKVGISELIKKILLLSNSLS